MSYHVLVHATCTGALSVPGLLLLQQLVTGAADHLGLVAKRNHQETQEVHRQQRSSHDDPESAELKVSYMTSYLRYHDRAADLFAHQRGKSTGH